MKPQKRIIITKRVVKCSICPSETSWLVVNYYDDSVTPKFTAYGDPKNPSRAYRVPTTSFTCCSPEHVRMAVDSILKFMKPEKGEACGGLQQET